MCHYSGDWLSTAWCQSGPPPSSLLPYHVTRKTSAKACLCARLKRSQWCPKEESATYQPALKTSLRIVWEQTSHCLASPLDYLPRALNSLSIWFSSESSMSLTVVTLVLLILHHRRWIPFYVLWPTSCWKTSCCLHYIPDIVAPIQWHTRQLVTFLGVRRVWNYLGYRKEAGLYFI